MLLCTLILLHCSGLPWRLLLVNKESPTECSLNLNMYEVSNLNFCHVVRSRRGPLHIRPNKPQFVITYRLKVKTILIFSMASKVSLGKQYANTSVRSRWVGILGLWSVEYYLSTFDSLAFRQGWPQRANNYTVKGTNDLIKPCPAKTVETFCNLSLSLMTWKRITQFRRWVYSINDAPNTGA